MRWSWSLNSSKILLEEKPNNTEIKGWKSTIMELNTEFTVDRTEFKAKEFQFTAQIEDSRDQLELKFQENIDTIKALHLREVEVFGKNEEIKKLKEKLEILSDI